MRGLGHDNLSTRLAAPRYAAASVNRGFFSKRNLAIIFGAALVLMVVIVAAAIKRGLTFTDTEVQQSLQQIKSQFKTQAEYVKAREQAGLTDADVLERAKLQLIQNKIQDSVQNSVGNVSDSDAKTYYEA